MQDLLEKCLQNAGLSQGYIESIKRIPGFAGIVASMLNSHLNSVEVVVFYNLSPSQIKNIYSTAEICDGEKSWIENFCSIYGIDDWRSFASNLLQEKITSGDFDCIKDVVMDPGILN